jgi:hypothetical protein
MLRLAELAIWRKNPVCGKIALVTRITLRRIPVNSKLTVSVQSFFVRYGASVFKALRAKATLISWPTRREPIGENPFLQRTGLAVLTTRTASVVAIAREIAVGGVL